MSDTEHHGEGEADLFAQDMTHDDDVPSFPAGVGMADVMAKILGKQLPAKSKSVVLAKSSAEQSRDEEMLTRKRKRVEQRTKREKRQKDIVGIDHTTYELETKLRRIATRGAVALFNAVRKQQKDTEEAEGSKEKVNVQSLDKKEFLGMLSSKIKKRNEEADKEKQSAASASAAGDSDSEGEGKKAAWGVLKDEYMLGEGKAKEWDDKSESGESDEEGSEIEDPSDINSD